MEVRTFIGTTTGNACTGNVTIGATTVIPGQFAMFSAAGNSQVTCSSVGSLPYRLTCPSSANWMLVNRGNGTGRFPVTCFAQ